MNKESLINTILELREILFDILHANVAIAPQWSEEKIQDGWNTLHATDYAVIQLKSLPGPDVNEPSVMTEKMVIDLAMPYVQLSGRFLGMLDIIETRHPWIVDPKKEIIGLEESLRLAQDLKEVFKVAKESSRGVSALRG